MFLNKRKPAVHNQDRTALQEAARSGASPGQKMMGVFTAVAGSAVLLGGFYYKVVRAPTAAQAAPTSVPPAMTPKLYVPLDLSAAGPSPQENQQRAQMALPPGMQPLPSVAPPASAGNEAQAPTYAVQSSDAVRKAVIERRLSGNFGSIDAADGRRALTPATASAGMPDLMTQAQHGQPPQHPQPPLQGPTSLSGLLVGTATPGASATYIPNQHMTLVKGTGITCSLDTAIQTDQMGITGCVVDYPVYSMDGKVVLLERGTKIDGEYARAMARGLKRTFVLWTRAVTPTGVVVDLASPGTDPLGRAGLTGEVDTKFWDRYGGALMFSVLQDGIAVGTSSRGEGNTQINLGNTQATGTTAAGEILRQNSDIMPSMSLPQGARVGITVARDLDFSGVYRLEPVAAR